MNGLVPPPRKIAFARHWRPLHHRSGWAYAMDTLDCLHCRDGVVLDGFIEKKFAWGSDPGDRHNRPAPYTVPWIGFIHNPPNIPDWFNLERQAPADILRTSCWQESARTCLGLFALSRHLKHWLDERVTVPVCCVMHPGETPATRFDAARYLANPRKSIVQVGWWLRRMTSLYRLAVTTRYKILLCLGDRWAEEVRKKELAAVGDPALLGTVRLVSYVPNREYDDWLSRNIAFLDLYDSSANNAIVDCITRATPLLVNPLPAVVEYLGADYPLYFATLEEAAAKAEDDRCVLDAHEYLRSDSLQCRFTGESFLQSFVGSEIYARLPVPQAAVPQPDGPDLASTAADASLGARLTHDWRRALAGDGQARAQWEIVAGGRWSWESTAVRAEAVGSEWSAYRYGRCDPQVLRALESFVVEVTVSGRAGAAGISFGHYKDFLVALNGGGGPRRLRLQVDTAADAWTFTVDGQIAGRCWWDSAVRNTADLVDGFLTLKARQVGDVRFQDLVITQT